MFGEERSAAFGGAGDAGVVGAPVGEVSVGDVEVVDVGVVDESRDAVDERRRALRCQARLAMLRQRLCDREVAAPLEDVEPVARDAVDAVGRLGCLEWSELDGGALLSTVLELEGARRALDAAIAAGMARVDASGASVAATGLVAHGWLAATTRGSRAAASRDVRLGRLLARFGGFAAAIAAGSLSIDHAVALDAVCNERTVDALVATEAELLEMAYASTFEAFRRDLRVVAARADVDGPEPDCSEVDTVSASTGAGGEFHLRGRFSGHNAVVMERALRDELDRQWRAAVREHAATGRALPSSGVLRARALAELVRRGMAGDPATATAPRTEAILEVRDHGDGCARVRSIDGEPVDDRTVAVFACDGWLAPIVVDPATATPLFAGRSVRYATAAQRRALVIRDGGCVFPGCDAPPGWCDAHHVVAWEDGGPTGIDNMALVCRAHHGLAHSTDWALETAPLDRAGPDPPAPAAIHLVWHTPDGRTIDATTARTRSRAAPATPRAG